MKLIIVRGLPGSGKSTFAKKLGIPSHYEADMYWGPNYEFDITKLKDAHLWCQSKVRNCLEEGNDCIVSNTFTTLREMNPYLEMVNDLGAEVEVFKMNGNYGSIHNVPKETVKRMKNRWEDLKGEIIIK